MDDKFKQDFITLFNQGFEEVVLPVIEDMQEDISAMKGDIGNMKGDIEEMKQDIKSLDTRVGRIERRLDQIVDDVSDHSIRLNTIESIPVIAHSLKISKDKSN